MNSGGSALLYSTYLGGNTSEFGNGVAIDASGSVYVVGYSYSPSTFPTTSGAFQNAPPAANLGASFVTKFPPRPTGTTSQTITFGALANEVYGAGPLTLNATASSGLTVAYTTTGPVTLQGDQLIIEGAGSVTVTAFQLGDSTYAAATPVMQSFLVSKAMLTATAVNVTRMPGAANPALTYQVAGYLQGDNSSVVGGSATLTTTATGTSPAGNYPITFATESLAATNYTFSYVAGTLTVSNDTTAPTVSLTGTVAGPPKKVIFSSQDNRGGSGLASVSIANCTNCTTSTTPFTKGTTSAVTTTATKTNQSLSSSVTIVATDVAGNATTFDPVDLQLESKGRPTEHLVNISSKENIVLISNGKPGMSWMQFEVNGSRLPVLNLSNGESTSLDIGRYLMRGRTNQVLILASGKDDATSWIIFTQP